MLQNMKKQVIFAKPMVLRHNMEKRMPSENEKVLMDVIKERIRQLEAGEVKTISNEQVFADIRERYGF